MKAIISIFIYLFIMIIILMTKPSFFYHKKYLKKLNQEILCTFNILVSILIYFFISYVDLLSS